MNDAVAMFVSWRAPNPDGDGGNHRSYQVLCDLQTEFGAERVHTVTMDEWMLGPEYRPPARPAGVAGLRSFPRRAHRRLSRMTENPLKLLTREGWSHGMTFGTRGILTQEFLEHFLDRVRSIGRVDVCLVDHPLLDQIRKINTRWGIPTAIASHNIESLDIRKIKVGSALALNTVSIDLANELRTLARYDRRFAISRVEAALISGVGLSCQFYPYVPLGKIRSDLSRIASMRVRKRPLPELFLLIGSATHPPTRRSLEWFVAQAARHGLPSGARVAVVGKHVTEILPRGVSIPGIECRGRVSDNELADLLVQARAALVPQRMGFGALTRIPELACAGLPVLVFPHASYAIDIPPGVHVMRDDSWSALADAMCATMRCPEIIDPAEYTAWEKRQPRPLGTTIRRLLAGEVAS